MHCAGISSSRLPVLFSAMNLTPIRDPDWSDERADWRLQGGHGRRWGLSRDQAVGDSDARGGQPRTRPITPGDFFSTVLHVLGIDPRIQYTHPSGRPMYMIEDGRVMSELV